MVKPTLILTLFFSLLLVACGHKESKKASAGKGKSRAAIVLQEFIFNEGPTPSCHASTIAETPEGLVAAWFGGKEEGAPDVDIWLSRKKQEKWTKPVAVATGVQKDGSRFPCWNPVLFQIPNGDLLLFYKVGPNPRQWWGMLQRSSDNGSTWSKAQRLPENILGPIKDKPVLLTNGVLLCGSSEEPGGWRVHMEMTPDFGKTWQRTPDLNDPKMVQAIQPTILTYPSGNLQILCRTRNKKLYESWSSDSGKSWSPLTPTVLPNPSAGVDAVTLRDGRQLLVYNHSTTARVPLSVAVSRDGKTWKRVLDLESIAEHRNEGKVEFSYPAVIQARDGLVHVTYTYNRRKIKHVVLDSRKISAFRENQHL